jgi:hypothetical protein
MTYFPRGRVIGQDDALFVIGAVCVTEVETVTRHAVSAPSSIFRCVLIPTDLALCVRPKTSRRKKPPFGHELEHTRRNSRRNARFSSYYWGMA